MKNKSFFIATFFLFHTIASTDIVNYKEKTKTDMLHIITSAHVRAFVVDSLVEHSPVLSDAQAWNETVHHVGKYVKLHSKNKMGLKGKKIMSALSLMGTANNTMICIIRQAHQAKNDATQLKALSIEINKIRDDALHLMNLIPLIKSDSPGKLNALFVLLKITHVIKVTANASLTHINKRIAQLAQS